MPTLAAHFDALLGARYADPLVALETVTLCLDMPAELVRCGPCRDEEHTQLFNHSPGSLRNSKSTTLESTKSDSKDL